MKRILRLMLGCIIIASLLLAGCSHSKGDSSNPSAGNDANNSGGSNEKIVTLKFWNRLSAGRAFFPKVIKDFEKENPNIHVKLENLNTQDSDAQYQAAVSGNNLPDVMTGGTYTVPQVVAQNQLHSLDSIFPEDVQKQFISGTFTEGKNMVNGHIYALPLYSGHHGTYMVWANKDVLNKYGIKKIPETWDEFDAVGQKIYKASHGKTYGLIIGGKSDGLNNEIILQTARTISPVTEFDYKTAKYNFATPGVIQTIQYYKKLLDDHVLAPTSLEVNSAQATALFQAGQAAFFIDGNWRGALLKGDGFNNWDLVNLPKKAGSGDMWKPYSGGSGESIWVSKYTKHWPEAEKFVSFLRDHIYSYIVDAGNTAPSKQMKYVKDVKLPFPQYNHMVDIMNQINVVVPNPVKVNPAALNVDIDFNNKKPSQNVGKILLGYLNGQVKDLKRELQKLSKDYNTTYQNAVNKNDKVQMKDLQFSNWQPTKPYTEDDYKALNK